MYGEKENMGEYSETNAESTLTESSPDALADVQEEVEISPWSIRGLFPLEGEVGLSEDKLTIRVAQMEPGACVLRFSRIGDDDGFLVETVISSDGEIVLEDFSQIYQQPEGTSGTKSHYLILEKEGERYLLKNVLLRDKNYYLKNRCVRWGYVSKGNVTMYQSSPAPEGETEKRVRDYYLYTFLNQGGIWILSISNEAHAFKRMQVCHLSKLSMGREKLTLQVQVSDTGLTLSGICLAFRTKLSSEKMEVPLKLLPAGKTKDALGYTALLTKKDIELKSLYWDPVAYFVNPKTGEEFRFHLSMVYRYRFFISYLYRGEWKGPEHYTFYPYSTARHQLAFQYRKKTSCDGILFHLKEWVALGIYRIGKKYWRKKRYRLVFEKFCMMAQDNGYYYFKYCMEHGEEQRQNARIRYVIKKDSLDMNNLLPYKKNVIPYLSLRHMIAMQATHLIVTTDTKYQLYETSMRGSILQRALRRKPVVFLQHGVTALKKVDFYYGAGKRGGCALFVVTSDFERDIVEEHFHYRPDQIANTGFARWDVLEDKSQNSREILIMPTWRSWLENATQEEFLESDYYRNYMELLNSQELVALLEKYDLKACFYLHSKFREFIEGFSVQSERISLMMFGEEPANELLMRCRMLVTDYSSVCWDVFYLGKPVIFFQFDRDAYLEAHGSYLDLEKDLIGDCAFTVKDLLVYMQELMDRDFVMKEHYALLQKQYYRYQDADNSKRICDAIDKKWPPFPVEKEGEDAAITGLYAGQEEALKTEDEKEIEREKEDREGGE